MHLHIARDLKRDIRSFIDIDVVRQRGPEAAQKIALGFATTRHPDEYAIAVRAQSEEDLPEEVRQSIETKANGQLDVQFTGPVRVSSATPGHAAQYLTIGSSIGHYRTSAGTLGFFARRQGDGAIGIVSANHVLAAEDRGRDEDDILHPAPADHGCRPRDVVAHLCGDYPRLSPGSGAVDCAFAELVDGIDYVPHLAGEKLSASTAQPEQLHAVFKTGRTTGRTAGRITAFDIDNFPVVYSRGRVRFNGLIEIESTCATPFARGGDSGSLVFNADRQPVGLLFVGSVRGGTYRNGFAYASPIDSVLGTLGLNFLV